MTGRNLSWNRSYGCVVSELKSDAILCNVEFKLERNFINNRNRIGNLKTKTYINVTTTRKIKGALVHIYFRNDIEVCFFG